MDGWLDTELIDPLEFCHTGKTEAHGDKELKELEIKWLE